MPKVLGLVSFRIFPTYMGGQKGVAHFYLHLQTFLPVLLATSVDNMRSIQTTTKNILFPNNKIFKNIFQLRKLIQLVSNENIDVIIAEHSYAGWIAWLIHRATGKRFIIHSHNVESKRFRLMHHWWWKLYHYYEGWIHRKAHHNFFISEEDQQFAIKNFKVKASRCSVVTYGVQEKNINRDKQALKKKLDLNVEYKILLFNGTLDYKPNYDAVVALATIIEPALRKKISQYQIIITGNRAPAKLIRKMLDNNNITYTGYVDDVDLYYQAADLFLNPLLNDSGVKTKVIEAISNNCTTISTQSGAAGIMQSYCSNKIFITSDNDWNHFVDKIVEQLEVDQPDTPTSFYAKYSWKNIAANAAATIQKVANQ